jgi:hypothetical protein
MLVCRQEMEKMLVITNRLSGLDGIAFDTTMGKCGRENAIGRNKKKMGTELRRLSGGV